MTSKYSPILLRPPKYIHKIFIPPKILIFLKTPKNIEIQNFEPPKMTRAYVCMKILEYPHPRLNPLLHRDAFSIRADPDQAALVRSGSTLFAYGNMIRYDPTLVDLTSNFFVLCTNVKLRKFI